MKKTKVKLPSGLHVVTWREGHLYVSSCLEVEVASQGKTKSEALKNIEEAIALYFADEPERPPKPYPDVELHSLTHLSYA